MSNKMSNKAREYTGKAKVFAGEKMNNPRLANSGRRDQMAAQAGQLRSEITDDLKQAANRARAALKR